MDKRFSSIKSIKKMIFKYEDYRSFLKDYFKEQKKVRAIFSYRYFAKKSGFNSPTFCTYVLDGRRNLSESSIDMFIKGLELSGKPADYFRYLVLYNQAKTTDQKEMYFYKMVKIKKEMAFYGLSKDQYLYMDKWYYPVVRELAVIKKWKDNYKLLASCVEPAITAAQAKEAVEFLLKVNLLGKNENGSYKLVHDNINYDDVPFFIKRKTRKEIMELAVDAVAKESVERRHVQFSTFTLNRKLYEKLTKMISEFAEEVVTSSQTVDNPDEVYNFIVALYPVSQANKINEKEDKEEDN